MSSTAPNASLYPPIVVRGGNINRNTSLRASRAEAQSGNTSTKRLGFRTSLSGRIPRFDPLYELAYNLDIEEL